MSTVASGDTAGKVKLESGTWDWKLRPQADGAMVTFQHRNRYRDEMRTWTPEFELSEARVAELAKDPVERLWQDADGVVWTIHVELPSDWARTDVPESERAIRLIFTVGNQKRTVIAAADTSLGKLTHSELWEAFKKA